MWKTALVSVGLMASSVAPASGQDAANEAGDPLEASLGVLVGGEWVSNDDPPDDRGAFSLVRSYAWAEQGHAIFSEQWKEYEDGTCAPAGVFLYAWNDLHGTVSHFGVLGEGGVIEGRYTSIEPNFLVLEFTFASPQNSLASRWRVEETFAEDGTFVEQAWYRQRGEWREASTNRFTRRDAEAAGP